MRSYLSGIHQLYLLKALAMGLATVLTIPKEDYQRLFGYGLIFGTLGDIFFVFVLTMVGLFKYTNMGPYGILGLISFWTPLAWGFAFMLFFRFIPRRRVHIYPYIAGWVSLSFSLGLMLRNFGLMRLAKPWPYLAPVIFLLWYSGSAWYYIKAEGIKLE